MFDFRDVTPRLGLPYVVAAQAQKHIPINESLARLDGLVQLAVESRSVSVQPASPASGGVWILPAGATGAVWAGQPIGTLMRFEAGDLGGAGARRGRAGLGQGREPDGRLRRRGLDAAFGDVPQHDVPARPNLANTRLEILEQEVTLPAPRRRPASSSPTARSCWRSRPGPRSR
jgi:hypothetical protein